jgi:group I intron endonuclease
MSYPTKCFGIIYKATNPITGSIYVGATTRNLHIRMIGHYKKSSKDCLLYQEYLKYGRVFIFEELVSTFNKEDLGYYEDYFIKYYNTIYPNGLNKRYGGYGNGKWTENHKALHIKNSTGRKYSQASRNKMSAMRKGFTSINRKKASKISGQKRQRKIQGTNIYTGLQISFYSIKDAGLYFNLDSSCISHNLKGRRKMVFGWTFTYV